MNPNPVNPGLPAQQLLPLRQIVVRDAVTGALAESASLEEAAPKIVRAICEALGWDSGALWTVEPQLALLRCVEVAAHEFEAPRTFARGVGLPGRVWESAAPAWIPAAGEAGLAALGFPILVGIHCVGVVEFFNAEIPQPDAELLDMLGALGSQIGQFVERRRAEQELQRYFTLSLDMLCVASYAGYFVRLNPVWERTLGYTLEELTSTPLLHFVHPEDRAATVEQMSRLSQGEDTISFENRYRAKDGSYRWMLWNATPFAQEQLIYAAARDITERKRSEENIRKLKEEAESANRAKTEFLAHMSHEMRTPLNVVIGMGDLLERTELDPSQRQYVRLSQNAGSDLLALINDLLDLSKAEAGRITMEEVDFDLPAVTGSLIEMMSLRAREKGIELQSAIEAGVPARLRGDPARLRQVLMNLLSNAIKFTLQGRIDLRVSPGPAPGVLHFSVSDTGIGIPAEKLDAIFEAFAQVDASTTRKYGGTGLGLAICRRLVEMMDGRLWVESEPGHGSTFHFTARFAEPGPAALAPPAATEESLRAQAAHSLAGVRILVADDSAENRFLVAEYLRDFDCQIDPAGNGQIAVEKFCSGSYGLVLMDLQMPVLDGFEATRSIRRWEREQGRPPTPVLALTASILEGELQRAIEAGCNACIRKPVRLLTLVQAVGEHLGKTANPAGKTQVRVDARLRAVAPAYLESRRADVQTLSEALERADYETIRELGHKMNGSGGAYGFPRITEIGQALEQAGRVRDPEVIRTRVAELAAYLDRVEVA